MYVVQCGGLSPAIYAGKVNAKGNAFLSKDEVTDMAIHAVGEYVSRNFEGAMTANFPKAGFSVQVIVVPLSPEEDS